MDNWLFESQVNNDLEAWLTSDLFPSLPGDYLSTSSLRKDEQNIHHHINNNNNNSSSSSNSNTSLKVSNSISSNDNILITQQLLELQQEQQFDQFLKLTTSNTNITTNTAKNTTTADHNTHAFLYPTTQVSSYLPPAIATTTTATTTPPTTTTPSSVVVLQNAQKALLPKLDFNSVLTSLFVDHNNSNNNISNMEKNGRQINNSRDYSPTTTITPSISSSHDLLLNNDSNQLPSPPPSSTSSAGMNNNDCTSEDSNGNENGEHQSSHKTEYELDKRKRNTAASARFRARKKIKEQALNETNKDLITRVHLLEKQMIQQQLEISWLRGLVAEKSDKPITEIYSDHGLVFNRNPSAIQLETVDQTSNNHERFNPVSSSSSLRTLTPTVHPSFPILN